MWMEQIRKSHPLMSFYLMFETGQLTGDSLFPLSCVTSRVPVGQRSCLFYTLVIYTFINLKTVWGLSFAVELQIANTVEKVGTK